MFLLKTIHMLNVRDMVPNASGRYHHHGGGGSSTSTFIPKRVCPILSETLGQLGRSGHRSPTRKGWKEALTEIKVKGRKINCWTKLSISSSVRR